MYRTKLVTKESIYLQSPVKVDAFRVCFQIYILSNSMLILIMENNTFTHKVAHRLQCRNTISIYCTAVLNWRPLSNQIFKGPPIFIKLKILYIWLILRPPSGPWTPGWEPMISSAVWNNYQKLFYFAFFSII